MAERAEKNSEEGVIEASKEVTADDILDALLGKDDEDDESEDEEVLASTALTAICMSAIEDADFSKAAVLQTLQALDMERYWAEALSLVGAKAIVADHDPDADADPDELASES